MSGRGWIGVDLDGTLAHYDGWKHATHIGEPIDRMVSRVIRWIAEGREVRIFTARVSTLDHAERTAIEAAIRVWCTKHIGYPLAVTCVKDYQMTELWDDRAVQVRVNTGEAVGYSTRGSE